MAWVCTHVHITRRQPSCVFDCHPTSGFNRIDIITAHFVAQQCAPAGLVVVEGPRGVRCSIGVDFEVLIVQHRIDKDLLLCCWTALQLDIMRERSRDAATSRVAHNRDPAGIHTELRSVLVQPLESGVHV